MYSINRTYVGMRRSMHQRFKFKKYESKTKSPHSILGVSENATLAEIKNAYLEKVKQLHPDVNPTSPKEKFTEVQAAYEHLLESHRDYSKGFQPRETSDNVKSQRRKPHNVYKDYTSDSSFKSHTDHAERIRREGKYEKKYRETEEKARKQSFLIFFGYIFSGYVVALSMCIMNYQIEDANRASLFQQIVGHFKGDPSLSWTALSRKRHIKQQLEKHRIEQQERASKSGRFSGLPQKKPEKISFLGDNIDPVEWQRKSNQLLRQAAQASERPVTGTRNQFANIYIDHVKRISRNNQIIKNAAKTPEVTPNNNKTNENVDKVDGDKQKTKSKKRKSDKPKKKEFKDMSIEELEKYLRNSRAQADEFDEKTFSFPKKK